MDRDSPGEQGRHGLRVAFPALMTSLCEARVREMLNTRRSRSAIQSIHSTRSTFNRGYSLT
jgi:hypothetical protein